MSASATQGGHNKAIVDHTSPSLCTPITPVPGRSRLQRTRYNALSLGRKPPKLPLPIWISSPCRRRTSHCHRQHTQKKDRACGSRDMMADRETDRQTDTQTYSSQYFATTPAGEVTIHELRNCWDYRPRAVSLSVVI